MWHSTEKWPLSFNVPIPVEPRLIMFKVARYRPHTVPQPPAPRASSSLEAAPVTPTIANTRRTRRAIGTTRPRPAAQGSHP
eukprot:4239440-Amphidinium_carterae.1